VSHGFINRLVEEKAAKKESGRCRKSIPGNHRPVVRMQEEEKMMGQKWNHRLVKEDA
jgi:hypothetical protein